jgi:hypothetical protein
MKVGIVGSREFVGGSKIRKFIYKLKENYGDELEIVSGGQKKGADGFAKKYALELDVTYVEFPPAHYSWNQHCIKEAYHYGQDYRVYYYNQRNTEIAEYSDVVICFLPTGWNIKQSRGTNDTYEKAKKLGKVTKIVNY